MARVKLTEHRAKTLFVDDYTGVALHAASLDKAIARLAAKQKYIIKVDQGIKKRGKQGLIRLNCTKATAKKAIQELAEKGFERFIAEPMVPHDDHEERYLSIERTREGMKLLYSPTGGGGG